MVQITIDTDKESPENIRRLIQFLQTLVNEQPPTPQFSSESLPTGDGLFNVFDDARKEESVSDMLAAPVKDDEEDDHDSSFFSLMEY